MHIPYLSCFKRIGREQLRTCRFAVETLRNERHRLEHNKKQQLLQRNIFPKSRLLFVHIPKTAGTSVHAMLSSVEDIISRPPLSCVPYSETDKHAKAHEWRSVLEAAAWDDYFSFCFVRNPWDLMVSSYFWWLQKAKIFHGLRRDSLLIKEMGSFDRFIHSNYGRYLIAEHQGTMSDWYSADGRDIVDHIGCVETFDTDMRHVLAQVGINPDSVSFRRDNATSRTNYRDYYTTSGRAIVEQRFSDVIDRFGYRF